MFARRGIVPEACSSWFLPRVVGISRAMEWCATGRVFGADEALAGGLVRSVHEPDELLPAAYALARRDRREHLGVSVALTRAHALADARRGPPDGGPPLDSALVDATGASPDAAEGVISFLEKRPPSLPGPGPRRPPGALPLVDRPRLLI